MQLAPQSYEMNIHISGMQNRVTPENSSSGITVLLISNVVQLLSFILLSLHTQYAEQGKVYVTVGCPSICLSVCPINRQQQQQRLAGLLLSALQEGDIDQ